jgi:hypothetical protein
LGRSRSLAYMPQQVTPRTEPNDTVAGVAGRVARFETA